MYRYHKEKLHVNHFLELKLKELRWELTVRLSKEMVTFLAGEGVELPVCGWETLPAIQNTIRELHECGIGTMLCIPNEEDLSTDFDNFRDREAMFDRNGNAILDCIEKTGQEVALQTQESIGNNGSTSQKLRPGL
ncbi:hypothetical protein pdam_00021426 [Pocillopora damicornis]|uniref:Uncharacterized protein n=1 Tax=Pocillopora damicornis TaxID=46731 RepID=A0A3M6UY94_POCDA|nr:hypothetical protein pdam_00021426 [Pocillopora damicornis]